MCMFVVDRRRQQCWRCDTNSSAPSVGSRPKHCQSRPGSVRLWRWLEQRCFGHRSQVSGVWRPVVRRSLRRACLRRMQGSSSVNAVLTTGSHFSRLMNVHTHIHNRLTAFDLGLHTHTHPFNGPFSRTTKVSRYQKGKTNLDFSEARDSEWQWHQLGHMQVCTLLQIPDRQTHQHATIQFFYRSGALPAA